MLGRGLGGKYGLPSEPPMDRHRWLFNLADAREFVKQRGARRGFLVVEELLGYYAYRRLLPKLVTALGKHLAPRAASLFAYHYCAVLKRVHGSPSG